MAKKKRFNVHLRDKFALIVIVTSIMILGLTGSLIIGTKKVTAIKNFQNLQLIAQGKISDLISTLSQFAFKEQIDSDDYLVMQEKINETETAVNVFLADEITKTFKADLIGNVTRTGTLWRAIKSCLEAIDEVHGIKGIQVNQISTIYESIIDVNDRLSELLSVYADNMEKREIFLSIGLGLFCCIFLSIMIGLVTSQITKRIKLVVDYTSVLADKDFTNCLTPQGAIEISSLIENVNNMVDEINSFFEVVKMSASKAISSGYSINDSANVTASASAEIDENIKDINEQFEIITNSVKRVLGNITIMNQQVTVLVENNARQTESIEESNTSVKDVVNTLEYINEQTQKRTQNAEAMHDLIVDGDEKISITVNMLQKITEQLEEVTEVVTIIDAVAEQTNLLSMNAAIESAHAGEAGKGFAVVAEEIRSLAEETTENAARIAEVISAVVNSVKDVSSSSSDAADAFNKISTHAEAVISSFREISTGIANIDSQMKQIKLKSAETSETAELINSYCSELGENQKKISNEVDVMNDKFVTTLAHIQKIKGGTADIVKRMRTVSASSKESYKTIADLENVLEQFKTKVEVEMAVEKVDHENEIETAVSGDIETLQKFAENEQKLAESYLDNAETPSDAEEIVFDLDEVEEYIPD